MSLKRRKKFRSAELNKDNTLKIGARRRNELKTDKSDS